MKDGSCLVNAVSPLHIVRCSQRFAAFFGYTADELHTRSLKCLFGDEPIDFEELIQSLESDEHLRSKISILKKDGPPDHAMVVLHMMDLQIMPW